MTSVNYTAAEFHPARFTASLLSFWPLDFGRSRVTLYYTVDNDENVSDYVATELNSDLALANESYIKAVLALIARPSKERTPS